jgi:hypothetical protein
MERNVSLHPFNLRDSRVSAYVPPHVAREVKRRAEADGRSVSSWVRRLLIEQTSAATDEGASNREAS